MKNNIENEITEINNAYEKANKEITKSFELKHEKLLLEEKNIKEKLQNEVTKVKEKLENSLSESNELIRLNEKIKKGVKIMEKEKNISLIKTLSYASKINKNKKVIIELLQKIMESIKISFIEDKNEIKFDIYCFNGIKSPDKVEFKEITTNSVKIFWNIENNKRDINYNNQIKYKVEIRKENSDEQFLKIYEGNNSNCLVGNLKNYTNYEVRICTIYKDIISPWGKIQKFKTLFDSVILMESKREDEFLKKIYEWSGYKRMELLYRGTKDGVMAENFHKKCDNQGPTICLYKNNKGNIFGGYASISWENSGNGKPAPDSFLFTLTNIHNIEPTKFIKSNKKNGVYHYYSEGPVFGDNDIYIDDDFRKRSTSYFPGCYIDILGKGKSIFTGDLDNNKSVLLINEIEVFKLYK